MCTFFGDHKQFLHKKVHIPAMPSFELRHEKKKKKKKKKNTQPNDMSVQ